VNCVGTGINIQKKEASFNIAFYPNNNLQEL
jgi:hypothetical protein